MILYEFHSTPLGHYFVQSNPTWTLFLFQNIPLGHELWVSSAILYHPLQVVYTRTNTQHKQAAESTVTAVESGDCFSFVAILGY